MTQKKLNHQIPVFLVRSWVTGFPNALSGMYQNGWQNKSVSFVVNKATNNQHVQRKVKKKATFPQNKPPAVKGSWYSDNTSLAKLLSTLKAKKS